MDRQTWTDLPPSVAAVLEAGAPRLGFGCGDLYGGEREATSARLLQTAYDAGVRHFDVARLYGNGSAEEVVGRALKPVRDRVVIVSKVGIVPWSMRLGARIDYKARAALRRLGPARGLVREPPPPREEYGVFAPARMRLSVERSLKALQTDYLDILLLHECTPADACAPETLSFLQRLQAEGKIRAFGVATQFEHALRIASAAPQVAGVVQAPSDALNGNLRRIPAEGRLLVAHSAIKHALPALAERLSADADLASAWSRAAGRAPDGEDLAEALLGLALQDNPRGLVLFSSSRPDRVARLARANPGPERLALARAALRAPAGT